MASLVTEDQDQRDNGGLEDLTPMTIESLRARLLSERALSKSYRQRADELARRVLELEEQLKMVSRQRKRAEKATEDVLAILESNGISDTDAYESNSEQETIGDSKVDDDTMKMKETSINFEVRRSDMEAYSSSEIDSSPSTGRSLSWKSCKDSTNSLQKTKYMETVRRRSSSFPSNSNSFPKRVGKSCRRIRRRENRSVAEQTQNDANMHDLQGITVDMFSKDSPMSANIEHTVNHGVNGAPEASFSGSPGNRDANAYYSDRNAKKEDVNGSLERKAQFSGQYEAEEKAQREWEEKVRENSSSVLDSCDPGNRSDVTEERDDMKASYQLNPEATTEKLTSNLELVKSSFSERRELKVAKNVMVPSKIDSTHLADQKTGSLVPSGSSLRDFTCSTSRENQSQVFSGNLEKTSPPSSHIPSISNGSPGILSAHGQSVSSKDSKSSGIGKELALMPQKPSYSLESVLEALQQARSSLNQKLQIMPTSENGSSVKGLELSVPGFRTGEKVEIPAGCPGIFRLPTDFQSESTSKANHLGSNSALIVARGYHEATTERFLGSPYEEHRSLANHFYGNSRTPFTDIRPGVQSASGLHPSAMPFMERQPGIPTSRAAYGNSFDTGQSSSSRLSYFPPRVSPGMIPGLHDSAMPLMEMQPGIRTTNPVYENAFDISPSSSGRSSYVDPQLNPGLLHPGRLTHLTYPFP